MKDFPIKLSIIILSLSLSSCANNPLRSYHSETKQLIPSLQKGDLAGAELSLNKNKQDVLYSLEHGTLTRMGSNYSASQNDFTNAKRYLDAWIASYQNGTLGLISNTVQAGAVNDNVLDYQLKDYEKVMLTTYRALNLLAMNNWSDARIEIQRMYQLEQVIENYRQDQYQKVENDARKLPTNVMSYKDFLSQYGNQAVGGINSQALALRNSYQNAFSHYLAGFIFEALGENSLARPGYLKALKLNPGNNMINNAIDDIDRVNRPKSGETELLIVEEIGHAPMIKSRVISVPFPTTNNNNNTCINNISIAFPQLIFDNNNTRSHSIRIDNQTVRKTVFTNFNLMASRAAYDNLPNIFIRNVLRAARDFGIQELACNKGGTWASALASTASFLINRADERTWLLLPNQIYVSRIRLKNGRHTVSVVTSDGVKSITLNLTKAYQVVAYRVIGNKVYFSINQGA